MREKWNVFKARLSMVWRALTESECVVTWMDKDGVVYGSYIATPDKWDDDTYISIGE